MSQQTVAPETRSGLSLLPIGIAASIVHALAMLPGYDTDGDFDVAAWLVMGAISLAVAAIVFLLVVPRGGDRAALILAILALLTCLVFWAMLSLPLAAGALVLALRGDRWRQTGQARAAFIVAMLSIVALAVIIVSDAMANG